MNQLVDVNLGFENAYSTKAQFVINAPGRVNLIGEHTDYNDGFVLPCAINYGTLIAVSARTDDKIRVTALDYNNDHDEFLINAPIEFVKSKVWVNYVRGVVDELKKSGYELQGCNLAIKGNIPQGAGLSSSAALEVGIAAAFNKLCNLNLTRKQIAMICQAAENNFVGCACGIMDQLISANGIEGKALGIDCRTLELTPVSVPEGMSILMVNSNVKRGLLDSEYNLRRQECESAAEFFGVTHLRDVSIKTFEEKKHELDTTVAKRAEHIVYENQRTLDAMNAFNRNDINSISALMADSHESMKTLFEITIPEIDFLVELVKNKINGKGGVRMTGGGFGGCIVALVCDDAVDEVTATIESNYFEKTGIKESIYMSRPVNGVGVAV
ncbi:galactokinase [Pseudoalteromonas carrageenovora]|uniref:galactokinase n=1 Tax=Pseudoalteromonas carrageenovora TaxID=227 RepID=UPI0026E15C51|nr:galactokinase [Pseudoalteromonas carrageenovora]MDO6638326.1 galactokinase [Pseudoalteromonas carrageenovora]MDO6650706.1 galactokinase [Pseudoalteromonas carrageenovora]